MVWLMMFILSSRFAVCFHSYKISSVLPEQWVWLSTSGALPRSSQTRSVYQFIIEAHVFLDVSCISHKAQLNTLESLGMNKTNLVWIRWTRNCFWRFCSFNSALNMMQLWRSRFHHDAMASAASAEGKSTQMWEVKATLIVAFSSFQFQALPVGDSFARRRFTVRSISVFLYFAAWF